MPETELETKPTPRVVPRESTALSRRGEFFAIFASGLAGALSLAVATYNVYLQRQQVRAQVWPHLSWSTTNVEHLAYNVDNDGVGPARVVGARVSIDGKDMKDWREVLALIGARDPTLARDFNDVHSTLIGRVFPPGGTIAAMTFTPVDGVANKGHRVADLEKAIGKLTIEICYCSTLDDCWVSHGFQSTPVKACPLAELTFGD
jgi:hypothetical protein